MPDLGPIQDFAHLVAGQLKQTFDSGNAFVQEAMHSGAMAAAKLGAEHSSNDGAATPESNDEDNELLAELNHLRRQVTALEDLQSGDISEHQKEVLKLTLQLQVLVAVSGFYSYRWLACMSGWDLSR